MALDLLKHVQAVKQEFDRTVECKHTSFDDLYPYMVEHQQFFWYKRYSGWASLLTVVSIADEAGVDWRPLFTEQQLVMIDRKVLDRKVLDEWVELSTTTSDAD